MTAARLAHLYSAANAQAARDHAIRQIDTNTTPQWQAAADQAIRHTAQRRNHFTTDALWYLLDHNHTPPPHDNRSMGARMKAAARAGLIEPTGHWHQSIRAANHRRQIRVWRSLLR